MLALFDYRVLNTNLIRWYCCKSTKYVDWFRTQIKIFWKCPDKWFHQI